MSSPSPFQLLPRLSGPQEAFWDLRLTYPALVIHVLAGNVTVNYAVAGMALLVDLQIPPPVALLSNTAETIITCLAQGTPAIGGGVARPTGTSWTKGREVCTGAQGPNCLQGTPGASRAKGDKGGQGIQGPIGPQGIPGTSVDAYTKALGRCEIWPKGHLLHLSSLGGSERLPSGISTLKPRALTNPWQSPHPMQSRTLGSTPYRQPGQPHPS